MEIKLTSNAKKVLQKRYLQKNEKGDVIETPERMFIRVAKTISSVENLYKKNRDVKKLEKDFFEVMANLKFLPNTPTLMNAGTPLGQLSACFVLPVEDSIEGIFTAVKYMAKIHQSGGGTGFSFSHLRPKNDVVKSTGSVASGPLSFMRVFDEATEVIKQGGRRRGANMGLLRVDHPDIMEFIEFKTKSEYLTNFNISIAITDSFMKAIKKGIQYPLINPRSKRIVGKIDPRKVFNSIAESAWKSGDPGLIFIDEINRHNPTPQIGEIESTNPCGEQPLLPYESCNLGSINLSKIVENREINWNGLRDLVHIGVNFLDNVIDVNIYPISEIEEITKKNRKIGLGVMGFAEMLAKLKIPYNSNKAFALAEKIMSFICKEARKKSVALAQERGSFPNFKESIWNKRGFKSLRNATLTTIAPTGTISIIAGVSSGIEPFFAISYLRHVMEGSELIETNPVFEEFAKEYGIYSNDLLNQVSKIGSIQKIASIPNSLKKIFLSAFDIPYKDHIKMQAVFQKYTDNAVSKTLNLPHSATVEDVKKAYLLAYKLRCKGITVFRYRSKGHQVLYLGSDFDRETEITSKDDKLLVGTEFSGECRICTV